MTGTWHLQVPGDGERDAAHAALDAGLAVARPGGFVAVTMRAPVATPAALLDATPAQRDATVWEPRDGGWSTATAGIAAEVRGDGVGRYGEVAAASASVWSRLVQVGAGDAPPPRFIGGFAFAPGAARGAWAGFGDARFVLPRWTYWRRGDAAWLTAVIDGDLAARGRDAWHGELADLRATLAHPIAHGEAPQVVAIREAAPAQWRAQIAAIRDAIAGGACAKIVAARTCSVELASPILPAVVMERLGERQPDCTRFAVRVGGRVFLGASPERLASVQGRALVTEALAGTIARTGRADDHEIAQLLASDKDRREHELVVEMIRRALAPLCDELIVPTVPHARTLRHLHHLHTPVRGTLAARRHLVDVAGALHPTPAVGGVPTEVALAWIAAHEPAPRGWYAAPVGWFDAHGDGELTIALRSGLIDGRTALLYAGAGIVRDSDAELELDETRVKLRPLLGALGAS